MWDLPVPGLKPGTPAVAGGFLTTVPPGKPATTLKYHPQLQTKKDAGGWGGQLWEVI